MLPPRTVAVSTVSRVLGSIRSRFPGRTVLPTAGPRSEPSQLSECGMPRLREGRRGQRHPAWILQDQSRETSSPPLLQLRQDVRSDPRHAVLPSAASPRCVRRGRRAQRGGDEQVGDRGTTELQEHAWSSARLARSVGSEQAVADHHRWLRILSARGARGPRAEVVGRPGSRDPEKRPRSTPRLSSGST